MRKLITTYGFKLKPEHKESYKGTVSQTVPDETLSIRQILTKYVRGQKIADEQMRTPVYNDGDFDSEDLEQVRRMDPTEQHEYRENLRILEKESKLKLQTLFSEQEKEKGKDARAGGQAPAKGVAGSDDSRKSRPKKDRSNDRSREQDDREDDRREDE